MGSRSSWAMCRLWRAALHTKWRRSATSVRVEWAKQRALSGPAAVWSTALIRRLKDIPVHFAGRACTGNKRLVTAGLVLTFLRERMWPAQHAPACTLQRYEAPAAAGMTSGPSTGASGTSYLLRVDARAPPPDMGAARSRGSPVETPAGMGREEFRARCAGAARATPGEDACPLADAPRKWGPLAARARPLAHAVRGPTRRLLSLPLAAATRSISRHLTAAAPARGGGGGVAAGRQHPSCVPSHAHVGAGALRDDEPPPRARMLLLALLPDSRLSGDARTIKEGVDGRALAHGGARQAGTGHVGPVGVAAEARGAYGFCGLPDKPITSTQRVRIPAVKVPGGRRAA
eukprot:scaffold990_cov393-Prasinococcus_capsulatus_cf.AAC.53